MRRAMPYSPSKVTLSAALLAAWALFGQANQAEAGYVSTVGLSSSRASSLLTEDTADGLPPVETSCAITSAPAPVDNEFNRVENRSSPSGTSSGRCSLPCHNKRLPRAV